MYRGEVYVVSCRQLGVAETKDASYRAANAWWDARQKEIDANPEDRRAERAGRIHRLASELSAELASEGTPEERAAFELLLGAGSYDQHIARAKATEAEFASRERLLAPDRMVATQVDAWKAQHRAACRSGQMSVGRFDAYSRKIAPFAGFVATLDAINETTLDEFYDHLSSKIQAGEYAPTTAHELFMTAKQFIRWLVERKHIQPPGNLDSKRFRFKHTAATKIEVFRPEEIRAKLAACGKDHERTKLYILLMLNCGMYQNDIAELEQSEVDWKAGTIRRARSKTRERDVPMTTYKLWPETFSLLKKYRATQGELVLLTEKGNPMVKEWIDDGGDTRKYDAIRSAWHRLCVRMGMKKNRLGMKHLRKTSSTLLGEHPAYKYYQVYFLADSPKGMSQKHYSIPDDDEFFEALDWLRGRILGSERGKSSPQPPLDQQA